MDSMWNLRNQECIWGFGISNCKNGVEDGSGELLRALFQSGYVFELANRHTS